jgi:haloalkane dehalogenase
MTAPLHEIFRRSQAKVTVSGPGELDLEMRFTDVGEGSPVLLLHGIPTWSFLFHDVIPSLSAKHRVIAPDLLGHGYSDRRDCFDRSLTAQRDAILNLLDRLEIERISFVGHDTGGGVALMMAIENPTRVNRLILSNIVAFDSWPIDDMIALGNPEWKEKTPTEITDFVVSGLSDGIHNSERLTDEFRDGIVAPYCDELGKVSLIRNASSLNTNHTTALVDRHSHIKAPTLMLWGVHDPWQKIADGERLASQIPDSRLERIEASHWIPWDAPDEFSAGVLDFLAGDDLR